MRRATLTITSTALFLATLTSLASAGDDIVIGVVGDSLSDEYAAPAGGPFLGYEGIEWVTMLNQERGVSFGDFDPTPDQFGQPAGFAYDHALKGAALGGFNTYVVLGLLPPEFGLGQTFVDQASALAQNFADGVLDAAIVQGGSNDLIVFALTGGSFEDADAVQTLTKTIVVGFETILDTPVPGGTTLADENLLLVQIPIFGEPDQQLATMGINAALTQLAIDKGVPMMSFQSSIFARADFSDPALPVTIGEYQIPMTSVASSDDLVPPGDPLSVGSDQCGFSNGNGSVPFGTPGCPTVAYQLNATQDDFVHPTTMFQALIASDVITALSEHYAVEIEPFGDDEIVAIALGDQTPRCCPSDLNDDCVVGVLDLLAVVAAFWNVGGPEDLDGDGIVTPHDLLEVVTSWGPCP